MEVHYDEGLANRIGPEPCAGFREEVGEASAGERAGQPWSREKFAPGADDVPLSEGNTNRCAIASTPLDPAWSENLACTHTPCTGTGRSAGWPVRCFCTGPHGEGEEP